ncbi:amidohydrolase [Bacillus pinisoli]|uniref:amidohydrolase n=1 Tax=Bacillus pinisoli TaxID=2901866 RepID=UPI001FF2AA7A|nr:amidohydrolase [Bacillus pinisoli]
MSHSINDFIESIEDSLITLRRELHECPELGFTEYVTTYKIGRELEKLGFDLSIGKESMISQSRLGKPSEDVLVANENRAREMNVPNDWLEKMKNGNTGLVAQLDTGIPGKHIAMRFDIDALPIFESKEDEHFPYQEGFYSKREGVMHACGHDGHAAIGIGVAHFLHRYKENLSGRFTLLFQPAEEGGRGAKPMVEKGWLDSVDYFLSGHIGIHSLPVGEIAATTTKFLASTKYNVVYKGKSAHAGLEPNEGRNALLAAAAASLHLNGITRHADGATRVNVGKLEAGTGRNIIADFAKMEIETRGETTALSDYMREEALRILKATPILYDVKEEIDIVGFAPSAECDSEWVDIVQKACHSSERIKNVLPVLPLGASEDVTFMIDHVQQKGGSATYLVFASPLPAGHHHPCFDFDEKVIPTAVEALGRILLKLTKKL